MNLIEKYALATPLTEAELNKICRKSDNPRKVERLLERWSHDVKEKRTERLYEALEIDANNAMEAVKNVASKTFLTEAQLNHLIDKNPHLDLADINESTLISLAQRELESKSFDDLYSQETKLDEAEIGTNETHGDINTIIFGEDDRIELPVGYTHIAVDFDGTVNAYAERPVLGEDGWEGAEGLRIGRVVWDDYSLQSGSNDINLLRNNKKSKMVGTVIQVHDNVNVGSQFSRAGFLQWTSDYTIAKPEEEMESITESIQMNRFLAIPNHMI